MFMIILAFIFALLTLYLVVPAEGLLGYIQSLIAALGILGFIYLAKLVILFL